MVNTAVIMGRITANPEIKKAAGKSVCSFTIAVDGWQKNKDGEKHTNFIRCVAWEKKAEFLSKYFTKGNMVAVTGSLNVRNFEDKNGTKREVTEINAERIDFTGEKHDSDAADYGY